MRFLVTFAHHVTFAYHPTIKRHCGEFCTTSADHAVGADLSDGAGPLGAFALWYLVARTILLGAAFYRRVRRPQLRWLGVLPPALIIIQIAFSSIDMGLTQSRTMIVLGTILGTTAALWRWRRTSSTRLSGTASG